MKNQMDKMENDMGIVFHKGWQRYQSYVGAKVIRNMAWGILCPKQVTVMREEYW